MSAAYNSGQDEATIAAANSIYGLVESLSGLNFTAYFEWNKSKKDGREWFNLRNERGNADQVISLDCVREPVNDGVEEATNLPTRTLIKGKKKA